MWMNRITGPIPFLVASTLSSIETDKHVTLTSRSQISHSKEQSSLLVDEVASASPNMLLILETALVGSDFYHVSDNSDTFGARAKRCR